MKRFGQTVALVLMWGSAAFAQENELRLAVPDALEASGFAQYLVPRFSLKTNIRISRVPEGDEAQMRFGTGGQVLFVGLGEQWSLSHDGDPRAERFLDWLTSDVGKRTIESFEAPDGERFSTEVRVARAQTVTVYDGDAAIGEQLSLSMCGRCHVVNKKNRMKGMGSTPSFAVLRGLPDWDTRFATFHLLNPHPSFTQIEDVTEAFDPALPPPIVPLSMTLADLEAILAYVAGIEAADLGAPIQVQ
jgi:mono/diheme cytochrome c family protein